MRSCSFLLPYWSLGCISWMEHNIGEMKHEYHEGPKASENFVKFASAIFHAKKRP